MRDLDDPLYRRHTALLKDVLSGRLARENGLRISYLLTCMDTSTPYDLDHVLRVEDHERDVLARLAADPDERDNYRERMFGFPFTMLGRARLDQLQTAVETLLAENIPGDLIEAGVWRGGATMLMKALLDIHGDRERRVWVADSFAGLPPPELDEDAGLDFHLDRSLAVRRETVADHFRRFGLLDGRVRFLEGWFADTLPAAPVERLALLRVDGDLYKSTMDALDALYDRVSPGGFVIVDDYGAIPACRRAVDVFRAARAVAEPLHEIDWTGVWWRKG